MNLKRSLSALLSAVVLTGAAAPAAFADSKASYKDSVILDVDFAKSADGADLKGHTMTAHGTPGNGEDNGIKYAEFDGAESAYSYTLNEADYEKMKDGFAVEVFYMPLDTENNNIVGNANGAGFCLEQASGTNNLQFWACIDGDYAEIEPYVKPSAAAELNKWNHIVAQYDGNEAAIYLNGEKSQAASASGKLTIPGESARELYLGGDTAWNGALELPANCRIAYTRLFGEPMTAAEIKAAYQAAVSDKDLTAPVLSFESEPAKTAVVGSKYAIPKLIVDEDSDYTVSVKLTVPGGEAEEVTDPVKAMLLNGMEYTVDTAGIYTIEYTARDAAGNTGSITLTVRVLEENEDADAADILDVDFAKAENGADAKGHAQTTFGEPEISEDNGIKYAEFNGTDSAFRYALTEADYAKMKDSFAVELLYMPLDTNNNNPVGNADNAGFCLEQARDTNNLQFWAHIGGYVIPSAKVNKGKWNHIVAQYDGKAVKMYQNGKLKDSLAASGVLTVPNESARYVFLGGDTTGDGALELPAHCRISFARIYSSALEDGKIAELARDALPEDAVVEEGWKPADTDVAARFFAGSDVHISNDTRSKFKHVLDVMNTVDPKADLLIVGDMTNNGMKSQYDDLMKTIKDSPMSGRVQMSVGNHELYGDIWGTSGEQSTTADFEERTGQKANQVLYYSESGVSSEKMPETLAATVVKMSPEKVVSDVEGENYLHCYDMLKSALEASTAKNPAAPVIIMGHHALPDTAYVTDLWYGTYGKGTDKDFVKLLEQYPQAIHISGHSHATLEDDRSIWQDGGFTAIQDGTLAAYFENEYGKADPGSGSESTYPAGGNIASQGLQIDILRDGTVKISRMNFAEDRYMFPAEPWVFNVTDRSSLVYTGERENSSQAPVFSGGEVSVSKITAEAAFVTFPAAEAASGKNADMIHSYKVIMTPVKGGRAVETSYFADYYMADKKSEWTVKCIGLAPSTEYKASVKAVTSYGVESEALEAAESITTLDGKPAKYPAEPIFDVDFSRNDGGADKFKHVQTPYGAVKFEKDEALGRIAADFDGAHDGLGYELTEADMKAMEDSFTVEFYFKPEDTAYKVPLGAYEGDGFLFQSWEGYSITQFVGNIGGGTTSTSMYVNDGEWNHVVAVYDGNNVKLYLNGQLAQEEPAGGKLVGFPHLMIGGDADYYGGLESPANCKMAMVKLYSGIMKDKDVAVAYNAAKSGKADTEKPVLTFEKEPETSAKKGDTYKIPALKIEDENGYSVSVSIKEPGKKEETVSAERVAEILAGCDYKLTSSGSYTITYTVTDDAGNTAVKTITINAASDKTSSSSSSSGTTWKNSKPKDSFAALTFIDVKPGQWFYPSVNFVTSRGIMVGVADSEFAPDMTVSRAMLVTILYRLAGQPAASGGSFSDIDSYSWYANAVRWAAANGIVSGYGDGSFGPDDAVTREQMAVIMMKYQAYRGGSTSARADLSGFTDSGEISSWAAEAASWAKGVGLIAGRDDGSFDPAGSGTRAEAAALLERFCTNTAAIR